MTNTKKEIEMKFKPKVLNINKLKKEKIVLTDTYSWRDFILAIDKSFKAGQKQFLDKFEKMIDDAPIHWATKKQLKQKLKEIK